MAFDSRVFRVLIASPNDVGDEREIAVRVIQEWNDQNSHIRKVVLLPLRWETHTAPEYGTRPQEVINRAIVDECDLLVGVFWTRIGTQTAVAESNTLEEIERVATAGKPIMLYFSKVGADPDTIEIDQLTRLRAFKQRIEPLALIENFKTLIDFHDKFGKQLELKIRELQKMDNPDLVTPLSLGFVAGQQIAESETTRVVQIPEVTDISSLAGFSAAAQSRVRKAMADRIKAVVKVPVTLAVSNSGSSGIRNLFVEMSIRSSSDGVILMDSERLESDFNPTSWRITDLLTFKRPSRGAIEWQQESSDERLVKVEDEWRFSFEWDALQPQRVRVVRPRLQVISGQDGSIEFSARVFADSFPAPHSLTAKLQIVAKRQRTTLAELIPNLSALLEAKPDDSVKDAGKVSTSS